MSVPPSPLFSAYVSSRSRIERAVYQAVAKPLFFALDPERVHDRIGSLGYLLGKTVVGRAVTRFFFHYQHPMLTQEVAGISFRNPIGLAAGFDKDAYLVDILPEVGFGFMEVGSITARPYAGNKGRRLWRLPKSRSLVVNYGLKNVGSEAIAQRLAGRQFQFPIGTSLAPTNDEQTMEYKEAIKDYALSYQRFATIGQYTTLNLSCPNTCNDQPFTDPDRLGELLSTIGTIPTAKPIFLKLSPDLEVKRLDALLKVAADHAVTGVICTNLIKDRRHLQAARDPLPEKGGIGGKLTQERSDAMVKHIAETWGKRFVIIGCGGVFTAEDAYRKIRLGASLIQLVTGMIYEGPQAIGAINLGLVALLKRDGFSSLADAIGADITYNKSKEE